MSVLPSKRVTAPQNKVPQNWASQSSPLGALLAGMGSNQSPAQPTVSGPPLQLLPTPAPGSPVITPETARIMDGANYGIPGPPQSLLQRAARLMRDPRAAAVLLSVGQGLTAPRQFGQTGVNQAINAVGAGYGALGQISAAKAAAEKAQREEQRKQQESTSKISLEGAQAGSQRATAAKTVEEAGQVAPTAEADRADLTAKQNIARETLTLDQQKARGAARRADQELSNAQRTAELAEKTQGDTNILAQRRLNLDTKKTNAEIAHIRAQIADLKAKPGGATLLDTKKLQVQSINNEMARFANLTTTVDQRMFDTALQIATDNARNITAGLPGAGNQILYSSDPIYTGFVERAKAALGRNPTQNEIDEQLGKYGYSVLPTPAPRGQGPTQQ